MTTETTTGGIDVIGTEAEGTTYIDSHGTYEVRQWTDEQVGTGALESLLFGGTAPTPDQNFGVYNTAIDCFEGDTSMYMTEGEAHALASI